MKVLMFGLFLSIAVPPGIVSSFTLVHGKVPAQRTSSLNMVVSATLDLENCISPDDEVSLSGGMTVGTLSKDAASHVANFFLILFADSRHRTKREAFPNSSAAWMEIWRCD